MNIMPGYEPLDVPPCPTCGREVHGRETGVGFYPGDNYRYLLPCGHAASEKMSQAVGDALNAAAGRRRARLEAHLASLGVPAENTAEVIDTIRTWT